MNKVKLRCLDEIVDSSNILGLSGIVKSATDEWFKKYHELIYLSKDELSIRDRHGRSQLVNRLLELRGPCECYLGDSLQFEKIFNKCSARLLFSRDSSGKFFWEYFSRSLQIAWMPYILSRLKSMRLLRKKKGRIRFMASLNIQPYGIVKHFPIVNIFNENYDLKLILKRIEE